MTTNLKLILAETWGGNIEGWGGDIRRIRTAILAAALFAVPLPAYAQSAPNVSNSVLLDICSESEDLATPAACEQAERDYLADPASTSRGYPPGDTRCTRAYQDQTRWGFWADDEPNCRGRLRRNIHWITLEDICQSVDAGPDEIVLVTDEIHPPLRCPSEPAP